MASVEKFGCGHLKTVKNSRRRSRGEKGVQCRACRIAQNVRWNKANPERVKANIKRLRKRRLEPLRGKLYVSKCAKDAGVYRGSLYSWARRHKIALANKSEGQRARKYFKELA